MKLKSFRLQVLRLSSILLFTGHNPVASGEKEDVETYFGKRHSLLRVSSDKGGTKGDILH